MIRITTLLLAAATAFAAPQAALAQGTEAGTVVTTKGDRGATNPRLRAILARIEVEAGGR